MRSTTRRTGATRISNRSSGAGSKVIAPVRIAARRLDRGSGIVISNVERRGELPVTRCLVGHGRAVPSHEIRRDAVAPYNSNARMPVYVPNHEIRRDAVTPCNSNARMRRQMSCGISRCTPVESKSYSPFSSLSCVTRSSIFETSTRIGSRSSVGRSRSVNVNSPSCKSKRS